MRYLIGVDDTDNLESRGTGFRARCLGAELAAAGLARVDGVSRHQLYVHPDIPYTSHNSSLCLDVQADPAHYRRLVAHCRAFLLRESAEGSDAGLCIGEFDRLDEALVRFGYSAKQQVLRQDDARQMAERAGVYLEGLTGDHGGIIGALAGVGLRKGGRDGRFVWLQGVRELSGIARAADLLGGTGVDAIQTREGLPVDPGAMISVDPWPRAVLVDGRAVLLVEKPENDNDGVNWRLLPREEIRRF